MMKKVFKFFKAVGMFFPIHLFFSQLKYNLILVLFWAFLFGVINYDIGVGLGLPYLFLSPDYLGSSSVIAFLSLGVSIGGFIMAFHLYSYFQLGSRYIFIATLARPFYKFMINNSFIPLAFLINLSISIYAFQRGQEFVEITTILQQVAFLWLGVVLFVLLALLYFIPTNKDLFKITGKKHEDFQAELSNIQTTLHRQEAWYKSSKPGSEKQFYYIGRRFRIMKSRSASHYDNKILNKVFSQNHINASVFEVLLVISYISIGFFKDYQFFQVPASVSIMMLLTVIIMLFSALFSWFKKWTLPLLLASFFFINYLSVKTEFFQFESYAFGMSYNKDDLVKYTSESLDDMRYSDSIVQNDYENYVKTLANWKKNTAQNKPKLIILNTSGGGSRSAMWTFKVLQYVDSISNNKVSQHIQMITGASGGMIGAAYYRDLILKEKNGEIASRQNEKYIDNISKDLLNRLSLSLATNDLFFRFRTVKIKGNTYLRDRGYAFEQELISNLDGALDETLGFYTKAEQSGTIPTMIFTPTIINDGRRLLISAQHQGYLQAPDKLNEMIGLNPAIEDIEFLKYFKKENPLDVSFSSVLRMNASFPYIMPMVSMPSNPTMLVMDAGIRDNYGTKTTIRYLIALRKWIKENTSGVIILKIRDKKKNLLGRKYKRVSLFERLFLPFGNVYGNFPRVQDYNQDELYSAAVRSMSYNVDVVTFNLKENYKDKISLSWHLTKREKEKIKGAVFTEGNTNAKNRLMRLLKLDEK